MKTQCKKAQSGYLLMAAIVLIVVVSFVGVLLTYMFAGGSKSMANTFQSNSAFNAALSGLEVAKHDVIGLRVKCSNVNSSVAKYTNAPLFGGVAQYTVVGDGDEGSTTLAGDGIQDAYDLTICVADASKLSPNGGYLTIGNEVIGYTGFVSGGYSSVLRNLLSMFDAYACGICLESNKLLGVTRGLFGTTATSHAAGSAVVQNQCTLTSVGGVPTIATPGGKRAMRQILAGANFSSDATGVANLPNGVIPAVVAGDDASLTGNATIYNPTAIKNGYKYTGSTVFAGDNVSLDGSAVTKVKNSSGAWVVGSNKQDINNDVQDDQHNISTSNLFSYYFSQPYSVVVANAKLRTNSNINGVVGETAFINGNLTVNGPTTIGSTAKPVILIVGGNVNVQSTFTFYGLLYATGDINLGGNSTVYGTVAAADDFSMNGTSAVTFDAGALALLGSGYMSVTGANSYREIFQ